MKYRTDYDLYGKNRWDLKRTLFNSDITMAANSFRDQLLDEFRSRPDMYAMAWIGARKGDRKRGAPTKQQLEAVRAKANIWPRAQNVNNTLAQVLEPGTLSIINGEIRTGTNGLLRPPPHGTASNDGRRRTGTKDGNENTELRFSCWTMAPYVFKPKVVGGVNIVAVQHPFSGSFVHIFPP